MCERQNPTHARAAGFTIIELLVAIALMILLVGSITYVFLQAQQLFTTTDATVQVYQNARYAFDVMERDLLNAEKTIDMEWFDDERGSNDQLGHFDLSVNPSQAEVYDAFRYQRGTQPEDGGPGVLDAMNYVHAMVLSQPDTYTGWDRNEHRNDVLYFRTQTSIEGETQSALVVYRLEDKEEERPILRRWVSVMRDDGQPEWLSPEDLCYYVTDLEFIPYVQNHRIEAPGLYLQPRELIQGVDNRPEDPRGGTMTNLEPGSGHHVWAMYQGNGRLRRVTVDGKTEVRFELNPSPSAGRFLPQVTRGSLLYLVPTQAGVPVREGDFTIDRIVSDVSGNYATFKEDMNLGPNDTVPVIYRVAWLPAAIQVRMHIKDAQSREVRVVSRVINLLGD